MFGYCENYTFGFFNAEYGAFDGRGRPEFRTRGEIEIFSQEFLSASRNGRGLPLCVVFDGYRVGVAIAVRSGSAMQPQLDRGYEQDQRQSRK